MRMTLYYLCHTVKNQIKKLFRTWVAVLLVVSLVFGLIVGLGVGLLADFLDGEATEEGIPAEGETLPEDEWVEEDMELPTREEAAIFVELIAGAVILLMMVTSVLGADKSGSAIFLPADVNLLFPSPRKPQSVLLFRLLMQTGAIIAASLYLLFQLPNLVMNLGLSAGAAFAILGAWFLLLFYSKLISVLLYTLSASHPGFKKRLRTGLYLVLALIAGSYLIFANTVGGGDYPTALLWFFNSPGSRFIPIWGWLKSMVVFAVLGEPLPVLAALGASLVGGVLLVVVIWRIKADFYEDAMARSAETAELQQAQANGKATLQKRKKDRSEKLKRDGLSRGQGASVYFYKAMYNRFRFGHLGYFTKTAETDLLVAVGVSLLLLFAINTTAFAPVALTLCVFTFFRALGNPIAADVGQESFFLIPDSAHKKVLFSFLGGIANSALDLLPAFIAGGILMRANPAEVLLWLLLTLSIGAYADSVGVFIDLSLSTGLSQQIRSLVQIMFIYFGLLPAIALLAIGFVLNLFLLFAGITCLFCLAVTAVFLFVAPVFVANGRR